jgi:hypothetical protein
MVQICDTLSIMDNGDQKNILGLALIIEIYLILYYARTKFGCCILWVRILP